MLIFHEGLPGSGKSFEAMVSHIVPALKNGRAVYAYIEGLDHEKIAEVAQITEQRCRDLLHQITRDQVPEIPKHVENDSLVVIDELQNFFPAGRQKLTPEITQFVTEHRHRGLDVLCMGQVLNDCHALWKGRIDTKIVFRKLDAIGKASHYKWTAYKRIEGGKFQETQSGKREYEAKYFGTYASHTENTENTGTYEDDRTNVKNSKAWKLIKVYGVVAVLAILFIVWFFQSKGGGFASAPAEKSPVAQVEKRTQSEPAKVDTVPEKVKPISSVTSYTVGNPSEVQDDYVDRLSAKYRLRLGGVIISKHVTALFEWRDEAGRLFDRMNAEQLRGLGWYVMVSSDGGLANISKPGKTYVATQWPLEDEHAKVPEKIPEQTNRRLANDADSERRAKPEPERLAQNY